MNLEGLEHADAAVVQGRVGNQYLVVSGLPPTSLSASTWKYSVVTPLRKTGRNASEGVPGAFLIAADTSVTPSCSSVTRKSSTSRRFSLQRRSGLAPVPAASAVAAFPARLPARTPPAVAARRSAESAGPVTSAASPNGSSML